MYMYIYEKKPIKEIRVHAKRHIKKSLKGLGHPCPWFEYLIVETYQLDKCSLDVRISMK